MGEQPGGEHTALSSVGVLGGIAHYDADIAQIEEHIGSIQSQRETLMAEFSRLLSTEQQLEHFAGLDMDLHLAQHTQYVTIRFGRLPVESYKLLDAYSDNPYILFIPISSDKKYHWGMYAAPSAHISDVDRVFADLFFERLSIPEVSGHAGDAIAHCQARRKEITERLTELDRSAVEYLADRAGALS